MNKYAIRSALISFLAVVLVLASSSALAQTTYRLTDLGTLGGKSSYGYAINTSGQVTGTAHTADGVEHPFLWDGTTMQGLGALDGTYGSGYAINDSGQVTGQVGPTGLAAHAFLWDGTTLQRLTLGGSSGVGVDINASGQVTGQSSLAAGGAHAFLWDGATLHDLGTLGGTISVGAAINAAGQVAGWSDTAGNAVEHALLWDGTTLQDLGTLGGTRSSEGYAINELGQVTGISSTAGAGGHAFLWDGTTMQDLGTLGGITSFGYAINASGQVTGWSWTAGNAARHAFLWDGTTMRDVTLGGSDGFGYAINVSGQVTGWSYTAADAAQHAFLWDGTTTHDLNALIDPADPLQPHVTLVEGRDINDRGQIVANGFDSRTGEQHAYLVSPAEAGISLAIEKHARLTEQGAVVITVHIVCGPLAGAEDYQENFAGAGQEKTGAEAEGGVDGTVVCDGVERTHTAHLSSFTEAVFRRGPAGANVSLFVCTLVGDEQLCFQGSTQRRVVISGSIVP